MVYMVIETPKEEDKFGNQNPGNRGEFGISEDPDSEANKTNSVESVHIPFDDEETLAKIAENVESGKGEDSSIPFEEEDGSASEVGGESTNLADSNAAELAEVEDFVENGIIQGVEVDDAAATVNRLIAEQEKKAAVNQLLDSTQSGK